MEFVNDIHSLMAPRNVKFDLVGTKLPCNKDIFFRAKQQEIVEQYEAARSFLCETETEDWDHWFNSEKNHEVFELIFKSHFLEASLMFYNVIVDLSWTLCYVSAEYVLYERDKAIDFSGMLPIEEAYDALRKAENLVTNPNSQGNPFEYLKNMCPEFTPAIDLIVSFWSNFADSEIRKLYNFIKHKGKPNFEEIEAHKGGIAVRLKIGNEDYPTDIREVQKKIGLYQIIRELRDFDDNVLFPYIRELLSRLETILSPSPLVF